MDPPPKTRLHLLDGLSRILHLHRLPHSEKNTLKPDSRTFILPVEATATNSKIQPPSSRPLISPGKNHPPFPEAESRPASFATNTLPKQPPLSKSGAEFSAPQSASLSGSEKIITDYDRIFDMVKTRKKIKLDEIARLLALKEERVAQELQTLEDNGLIEVNYPAFGEPLICYKNPDV